MLKVLAIIVHYHTPEYAVRAIDSFLAAIARVPDCEFQLVVVENDAKDASAAPLAAAIEALADPRVTLLASPRNVGFAAGNNRALAWAEERAWRPDFVYLQNPDAFLEPDALAALVSFMRAHPRAGIAGSSIHGIDDEPHITLFRFPTLKRELLQSLGAGFLIRKIAGSTVAIEPIPEADTRVDWVAGASMLIRREALDDVGGFDDRFFLYYEETDFCRRAAAAGWECWWVAGSRVAHVGSVSTGMKRRDRPLPDYWFVSRRHYLIKHHGRAYLWACNVAHLGGRTLALARDRVKRRPRSRPPRYLRDFTRLSF